MMKKNEVLEALAQGGYIHTSDIYRTATVYTAAGDRLDSCRYDTAERIGRTEDHTIESLGAWSNARRIYNTTARPAARAAAAAALDEIRTPGTITLRALADCYIDGRRVTKGETFLVTVYGDGTQAAPGNAYGTLYGFRTESDAIHFEIIDVTEAPRQETATMTTQEAKTARAALIEAHAATRNDGPAAAVAALVDRIGYDAAREIVALLIVAKGEYDGRISERCRAWAYDLTGTTRGTLMARGIYYADEIHPAHMDQIGRAMMEYTPEPEPAQEATQEPTPEPAPRIRYVRADYENGTDSAREALEWHRAGHDLYVCRHGRGAVLVHGAPQEAPQERDENRDHCRAIAEDLERYAAGLLHRCPDCGREIELPDDVGDKYRCPGCGQTHDVDDLEQLGIWDYFQDVYDMDWILDSNREYKACRLMVACGGPNIYISTYDKRVELFWWSESATYPLTYAAAEAVDEWAAEYWACCQ